MCYQIKFQKRFDMPPQRQAYMVDFKSEGPDMGRFPPIEVSHIRGSTMPNATTRRSVVGSLVIVALAVTAWSAVAQAGPIPTPVPTGSVVGWGHDQVGQASPPDAVNGVAGTATEVAAGYYTSCAIQAGTGNVVCWGNDYSGQATPPDAVNGASGTATDIAAGGPHSCAIQAGTGEVVCWGSDRLGQATPPDAVNGVSGTATDIGAGFQHSCAIQAGTGNVVCWGDDGSGRATPPDAVNGVSGTATDIAMGYGHNCAIQAGTGYVVCWGYDGRYGKATPPDAVNGVSGTATDIAAGGYTSCAIQAGTGEVVCWGTDRLGQATPPDAVNGVSGTATDIAAGLFHNCAIQAGTGEVVCWGDDAPYGVPTAPPDTVNGILGTATDIAAGGYHTIAIVAVPSDCLCEVQNIKPNQVSLKNVGTGGNGSTLNRNMIITVRAVDAPGAACDPGDFSDPTSVNLKMEDDGGNVLVDSAKIVVCEHGVTTNLKWNVFFQGPDNCENGAVPLPKPDFSLGTITSTGSAPGTADYVESTKIKCFE
jgi:hypothetical protein